ncbi:MAG: two-component regulator propeller domain-containing protein [Breznakibacter sp.]
MRLRFVWMLVFASLLSKAETTVNASYYFSRIDSESGLSQINVKTILQDSYGFMWFGTRNHLNRYDGTRMRIFDCYDSELRRRNNNISALYEDKDRQLWVGTDKGIYVFDPISERFSFFGNVAVNGAKITDWVSSIQGDLDGNIWIVIPNEGLFRYHEPTKKLSHYVIGNLQMPNQGGNPQCMCIERNGTVWIGTNGNGVYSYDKKNDSFIQYWGDKNGSSLRGENIYTMCDYGDELVLGIHEGRLMKLNKRRNVLSDVKAPEVHYKIIRYVTYLNDELWVGTEAGLFIINELKNSVIELREDPMYAYSLSDNIVESIYKDKENGVWIGTRFGGANYLASKGMDFECYVPLSNSKNSLGSRRLREIREDSKGNIWIASEDKGLNILDPQKAEFRKIEERGADRYKNSKVLGLYLDEEQAWVGYFKNGMDVIRFPRFTIEHYSGSDLNLDEASVYSICEDKFGKIWIGNGWGIFVGSKKDKYFRRIDKFGLSYVYDIMEDSKGYIWIATMGNGVFRYNQTTEELVHYLNSAEDSLSLSSNSVSDITETTLGDIWFATDRGGICRYNRETDDFTTFSIKEGLPDDVSYKIIEDKEYNLWFGTNNGLVKFNPRSKKIKVFSKNSGLPINQFNYKSALAGSAGKFYFGGLNGLLAFNPSHFEENRFIPPVYITQMTIHNSVVGLNVENSPLEKSMVHTKKITLNYDQSNIGFDFVALSFAAPKANKYAYMMEGIDKDWIYVNANQTVSYAKLPPGDYVFKVMGSNNDEYWNKEGASVEIEILPPWWRSKAARIFYVVLFAFTLYLYLERYRRRTEKRHAEMQRLFESEKEKELYSSKVEFFTNIAHEIRTPVTLINGPLESMLEIDFKDPEVVRSLKVMSKNTNELLGLVNQLLDFRKVDSNKFLLTVQAYNVTDFLKEIYSRFEPLVSQQNKTMKFLLPENGITFPFDKEAMSKVMNNLLSNALKYSERYIEVELKADNNIVYIKVRNDGDLIPMELGEKIFDPFFQRNKHRNNTSSSGIGLSLARSLAELHNGRLYYNEYQHLNEFVMELPLTQKDAGMTEEVPEKDYLIAENELKGGEHAKIILLVEDNKEMLDFIAERLQKQFGVEKATNGIEAMKILEDRNVDLVLTDIMMPEMDGFRAL